MSNWIEKHSVNCIVCGKLVDERDCIPGPQNEGDDCPACQKETTMIANSDWAQVIAARIAEDSPYNEEDKAILADALVRAFSSCPEAVQMLIGTGVIEEDYFDDE